MTKVLWFGVALLGLTCIAAAYTEETNTVTIVALVGVYVVLGFIGVIQELKKLNHD